MSDFNLEEEIMRSSDKWDLYSSAEKYNLAMSNYWEGKFDAYTNCRVLASRIEKLEQQLSNSISKDKVRRLVEKAYMQGQADEMIDPSYSNAQEFANKLLTNKEEG